MGVSRSKRVIETELPLTAYKFKNEIVPIQTAINPPSRQAFQPRYRMIRWWARKPWWVIREYIEHYTQPGDIILDPFCGSGIVPTEALILRRKVIAVDLNPIATFITRITVQPMKLEEIEANFKKIENGVADKINSLYSCRCKKCNSKATIIRLLWKNQKPIKMYYTCKNCKTAEEVGITKEELQNIKKINSIKVPFWYPKNVKLPEDADVETVDKLFTKRNLIALSILYNEINKLEESPIKELMKFIFCATLPQVSKMIMRLDARGMGSWVIHRYWIPKEHFEMNVWHYFKNRYIKAIEGKKQTNSLIGNYYKEGLVTHSNDNTFCLFTKSSTKLSEIPNESIDYVFTDPPYGGSIRYLDLCSMWMAWLNLKCNQEEEIIVKNKIKTYEFYQKMLTDVFQEVYRVLKPERYMSLTFHNRDLKVWSALLKACKAVGFKLLSAVPQKPIAPSVSQTIQEKSLRNDLVLTFIKSKERDENKTTYTQDEAQELILNSIRKFIEKNNGATTSEIYDFLIPLLYKYDLFDKAPKDFVRLLGQHFMFKNGKWY
jgi:DNA modification methylase